MRFSYMRRYLTLVLLLLSLAGVATPIASAHTVVPALTCNRDGCDGKQAAAYTCTNPTRWNSANMINDRGQVVGYLYLYSSSNAGCYAFWGTFVLIAPIQSAVVYTTRTGTTDDPKNESFNYANIHIGSPYNDAPMLGCDYDRPNPDDTFNSAVDWIDYDGYQHHTEAAAPYTFVDCYE